MDRNDQFIGISLTYVAAGVVAFLLAVGVLFFTQQPQQQSPLSTLAGECGNLTDISNVQHLSHHPQQYKDCYRRIDPQVFEQATGMRLEDFLKRNGIA